EILGVGSGPDAIRLRDPAEPVSGLASMTFRVGFYRPVDDKGFNVQEHYHWGRCVPVADMDGTVSEISFKEVTFRQLLASQQLGLIEGDVTRPYICPSMPQGDIPSLAHAAQVGVEAARAAYAGVDVAVEQARDHASDIGLLATFIGACRGVYGT